MLIFPDSGASICLAGPQHLKKLGLATNHLIPCRKQVTAVGGYKLICHGWLSVQFQIGNTTTNQPLYICDKVDRLYFSRCGCTDVNILPATFPYPMVNDTASALTAITSNINHQQKESDHIPRSTSTPLRPTCLPFPATEANIPKLEKFLRDQFQSTAFNNSGQFPLMSTPPAHIHLKPDATPYARHTPIPIPFHWKADVKASLDADVARGIIKPVPIGTPTKWCSPMAIISKKDGRPQRTVDLQQLNSQCLRETHHCQPPFQFACQVPHGTKKTVLDAVDGYHAVALDIGHREPTPYYIHHRMGKVHVPPNASRLPGSR